MTKNPDYTASAISITNPVELEPLLAQRRAISLQVANFRKSLEENPLYENITEGEKLIATIDKDIKVLIDEKGGYQDIDTGFYALKQRRVSITYIVNKVKEFLRPYASAIIEETVSKSKIEGLRKGGLISQEDLDRCSDTKETFAYIIKTPEGS